ncbi:ribosomal protein S5 (apicoplast) [Theileria orientalis]|uniref:Ribosomal protein S5 n=1 Tax=Theileria orientalis TaxID=68886 RepID=A0A976XIS2_THEOR|nr:ribosomal protein S5 [Theileria orientalis]
MITKKYYLKEKLQMILKINKINSILTNILYTKHFYNFNINTFKHEKNIINCFLQKNHYFKIFLYDSLHKTIKKRLKRKAKNKKKLQKIILNINRTSLTLKTARVYRYRLITGIGLGNKWVGIGQGKNKLFKDSYAGSLNTAKKNIYNLNFNCNDYKYLKYKGCKFRYLNMSENKNNLQIYNNISKLSGDKKIKLISYSSKTPINILKSLINF